MTTMQPPGSGRPPRGGKPAVGRPALFVVLLALASAGVLALLVAGPGMALPAAIACAAALMGLVGFTWAVAGPRL